MVINRSATVVPGSQRDGYFFVRENDGQGDFPLLGVRRTQMAIRPDKNLPTPLDGTAFTLIFVKDALDPDRTVAPYELTGAIQT